MAGGPQREHAGQWHTDLEPGYYDRVYRAGRGVQWYWHRQRFQAVVELLPAHGERLLDLGCGPGTFLGHFAGGYRSALGVDLSAAQVAYATATYGSERLRFQATDIAAFASDERFDAIVSIEVIEHLPRDETRDFLSAILRHLEPGGVAVLTTPNYRSLWPLLERVVSVVGAVDYRAQHVNPFTRARLEHELAAAGFVAIRARSFFVAAPFLAGLGEGLARWVERQERRLLPGLGAELVVAAQRPVSA